MRNFKFPIVKTMMLATAIILTCACQKENFCPPTNASDVRTDALGAGNGLLSAKTISYTPCGIAVNNFTPVSKYYSFAYTGTGTVQPYHIQDNGNLSFNTVDMFSFVQSGFSDPGKTIKTWRIKRTDGKYLTNTTGSSAKFLARNTGPDSTYQVFMPMHQSGNNFKLICVASGTCWLGTTGFDFDGGYYHLYFYPGNNNSNVTIYMFPYGPSLPPNTN